MKMKSRGLFAAALAGAGVVFLVAGCPKPDAGGQPVATSKPAGTAPAAESQPPPPPVAPPDPHQRVEVRVRTLSDPQDGWLRIEAIRPDAPGAWATGAFIREKNKIVIETENVDQFSIRLPQLHVNWDRRVILRIDGHSSELMWKRRPILHLRRTPVGAWEVVEP